MSEIPKEFMQIQPIDRNPIHPENLEDINMKGGGRYSETLRDFWQQFDPNLVEEFRKFYGGEKTAREFVHQFNAYYTKDDSGADVFILGRLAKARRQATTRPAEIFETQVPEGWMYSFPPVELEVYLAKSKEFLSEQSYTMLLEGVEKDLRKQ